jgi:hypothetical protein
MYLANLNYFFKIWRIRAHKKNARMCRKNKFQVETMKINSPQKKNLAMGYIERFWKCSL